MLIPLLVNLLILAIVVALVWYILQQIPLPEPFGRIAQLIVVVIACIALIYLLLGVAGSPDLLRVPR